MLAHDHSEIDILLEIALAKLRSNDSALAFRALDLFWGRLAVHIRAEHLHLFPAISKISESQLPTDVPGILADLRTDHDFFMHELADMIKTMRNDNSESRQEEMQSTTLRLEVLKRRLADHNGVEETRIYRLINSLVQSENELLSRSVKKELDNLPPRFVNPV